MAVDCDKAHKKSMAKVRLRYMTQNEILRGYEIRVIVNRRNKCLRNQSAGAKLNNNTAPRNINEKEEGQLSIIDHP